MAEGVGADLANAFLSAVLQAGPALVWTNAYMQFYVGAPGAAGTSNPAAETRRIDVTGCFSTDPVTGVITQDATIGPLLAVAATEVWSHWAVWSTLTTGTGTFGFSGVLTGGSVNAGDDVTLPPGTCVVTVPVAS